MGAELQNINQGLNMKVKKEIFENDETRLENRNYIDCFQTTDSDIKIEIDDNKKLLWNECSQEMKESFGTGDNKYISENSDYSNNVKPVEIINIKQEIEGHQAQLPDLKKHNYSEVDHQTQISDLKEDHENFETDNNIFVSENSDHGKVKLIEIINVKQEIQNHREQISDLKDRSYLGDDSKYKNTELTDFVIKTEFPSGDLEAGCSYDEDSNIVAEDRYVKVDLKPETESGDGRNEKTDVKLEDSGSFMASFDQITKNDFQHTSNDQSHIGSYDPTHKWVCINYEKGSKTQYVLGHDSISCRFVESNRDDEGNHTIEHSCTERTYQCNICEKEFKTQLKLKHHIMFRNHMTCNSTERQHMCNVCEKRFKDKHYLKIHMTRHGTERLHKCDKCKKGFKTAGDLRSHTRRHTTDRPHQCNMCVLRFKIMNDLTNHMKHHGPHHR